MIVKHLLIIKLLKQLSSLTRSSFIQEFNVITFEKEMTIYNLCMKKFLLIIKHNQFNQFTIEKIISFSQQVKSMHINQIYCLLSIIFKLMRNQNQIKGLGSLRWELKPKLNRYPPKRWGHAATIYNKKLIIYGGKTGRIKEPLYCINCQTYECQTVEGNNMPKSRQSHSFSLAGDKIYVWGGCHNEQILDQCIEYNLKGTPIYWNIVPQFRKIKPRQSHCSVILKDKFILVYGGSDSNQKLLNDFHIFNTETHIWFQIKSIQDSIGTRIGSSMEVVGDYIYLFGGQMDKQAGHSNEIFRLSFDHYQFQNLSNPPILKIEQIKTIGTKPMQRSCHSCISYKNKFLIILGGETSAKEGNNLPNILLNDIWCFDTTIYRWHNLQPKDHHLFKPRSSFSSTIYKNKIFIFGGLIQIKNFKSSDELLILWIDEQPDIQTTPCNLCKLHFMPPPQDLSISFKPTFLQSRSYFNMNLKTFFQLSELITHPYEAISIIIDKYKQINCSKLQINLVPNKYIMICGNSCNFTKPQLQKIMNNFDYQLSTQQIIDQRFSQSLKDRIRQIKIAQFSMFLKLAAGKLGNSFIFLYKQSTFWNITLVTRQGINRVKFNIQDMRINEEENVQLQIIKQHLNEFIGYDNFLNLQQNDGQDNGQKKYTFIVFVTNLQKFNDMRPFLTTVQQTGDIIINQIHEKQNHKNFNNGTQEDLNNSSNISSCQPIADPNGLFQYLRIMYLNIPQIKIKINGNSILFNSLKSKLQNMATFESKYIHNFLQMKFSIGQKQQTQIFYYVSNKVVGKFSKKGQNNVIGYIILPSQYKLNFMQSKLQNNYHLNLKVEKIIEQFVLQSKKRNSNVNIIDLQNQKDYQ